jgi:hypothetical protein
MDVSHERDVSHIKGYSRSNNAMAAAAGIMIPNVNVLQDVMLAARAARSIESASAITLYRSQMHSVVLSLRPWASRPRIVAGQALVTDGATDTPQIDPKSAETSLGLLVELMCCDDRVVAYSAACALVDTLLFVATCASWRMPFEGVPGFTGAVLKGREIVNSLAYNMLPAGGKQMLVNNSIMTGAVVLEELLKRVKEPCAESSQSQADLYGQDSIEVLRDMLQVHALPTYHALQREFNS